MSHCMVLWCENKGRIPGVSYFKLTKERYDVWMKALGRNPNIEHLGASNCVCSDHFTEDNIIFTNKRLRLKSNAVPTLKLRKRNQGLVGNQEYLNSQTKGVGTPKRHFPGRVYCRLCLEPAARDQMVPLTLMDINFTDKSKAYKQAETMQTHRITNIIRVVMPEFDFDSVYNPMVCDKCIARLESVYSFIKECQENENIIQLYKSNFSPNEKLVSCEDVAQNKSLLMKQYPPRKRQKTPKKQNSTGSISGSGPEQSESGLFDDSQYERHEIVNTGSGDSQENFATETGTGLCSSIKCETEDYEDYSSYMVKSEEISCIVKEESVSEVISCDIADTPTNERICQPDMDYPVKIEDCSQSDALGMSEIEDYHNIPSEYFSSNQKSQTFSRTKT